MADNHVTLHDIEAFRAMDFASSIAWMYREAYGCPDSEALDFAYGSFAKHVRWPEFTLTIAAIAGQPVGFVYGHRSAPGQWWYDTVAPSLRSAGHAEWLTDACELAEIAIAADFQKQGIGSLLLDAFGRSHGDRRILLSVEEGSVAKDLYTRHGFVPLVTDFRYPGFDERIVLMGRPIARTEKPVE